MVWTKRWEIFEYMQVEDKIKELVDRLEKIAKKNKDEFDYKISIRLVKNGFMYLFECFENSCGHLFLEGIGSTIERAVSDASKGIEDSCREWDYKL